MSPITNPVTNNVSQNRPHMRLPSVRVNPSFFFFAMMYSTSMRAIPNANVIPPHRYTALPPLKYAGQRYVTRSGACIEQWLREITELAEAK